MIAKRKEELPNGPGSFLGLVLTAFPSSPVLFRYSIVNIRSADLKSVPTRKAGSYLLFNSL